MIRVFAGCAPNHEDAEAQAVFEWSLRKHASEEIQLTWLKLQSEGLLSGWNAKNWATPFTGLRWAIPQLCEYKGKAIYCDSDFIFFDDIAKLFHQHVPPSAIALGMSVKRMCILVWDCEGARRWIPDVTTIRGREDNHVLIKGKFFSNPGLLSPFKGNWNCLEGEGRSTFAPPDVSAVHYTSVPHQPHLDMAIARLKLEGKRHWFRDAIHPHPNRHLVKVFMDLLQQASGNGYGIQRYMNDPVYGDYKTRTAASLWLR